MLLCTPEIIQLLIEFFTGAGSWSQLDPLENLFELNLFRSIIPSLTLF